MDGVKRRKKKKEEKRVISTLRLEIIKMFENVFDKKYN